MSKTRNDSLRQQEIACLASGLVDPIAFTAASPPIAKAIRILAQQRLMELTGCTLKTARRHIVKALEKVSQDDQDM